MRLLEVFCVIKFFVHECVWIDIGIFAFMRLKCFFGGWLVDWVKHFWSSIFRLIRYLLQTYKVEVYIYYICAAQISCEFSTFKELGNCHTISKYHWYDDFSDS